MSAPALMTTCFLMLIPFLLEVHLPLVSPQLLKGCGFSAIYNFGDSLSDTGNALVQLGFGGSGKHPYGMSVGDGKPTGRFSDGYLIIDRIAESAGLPHCNPYLRKDMDHSRGANFAVAGVGVLSKEIRDKFGMKLKYSQSSLDEQLKWFVNFSNEAFQNESARKENFESALFVLGGGGNDYGGFKIKGGPEEKKIIMPYVIAALKEGLKASPQLLKGCGFSAIYNFGDSMSDTGNALMQFDFVGSEKHPYGMSVGDGKPTDKFSDGYLLIDRIAELACLPHCNPYLRKDLDHTKGANFAVAGVGLLSKAQRDKLDIRF